MADFRPAVEKILAYEGGYVNDPDDPGGETNFGISKRAYPHLDIKALTEDEAKAVYRSDYWSPISLDLIRDQRVAEELFDSAVNIGVYQAVCFLQEALAMLSGAALIVDGRMGRATLDAANAYKYQAALAKALNGLQFRHYWRLCQERPKMKKFLRSWLNRVEFNQ